MAEEIFGVDNDRIYDFNLLNPVEHVLSAVDAVWQVSRFVGGDCALPFFEGFAVVFEELACFIHPVIQVGKFGQ